MGETFGSGGWAIKTTGINKAVNRLNDVSVQFDGSTTYVVGPQTSYAIYHELGTSKMQARPFMRPAAERVSGDIAGYAQRVSRTQGIPLNSEANIVRCVALAVEDEAKRIAKAKGVEDTGATIASIEARRVS
ncbi:HK97-gp10 family putative phage morphogenesis protein [Natronorarus salvus]|uniref:HK97-gp10 family putative phage morphogenesis protein n=1 Tax=Natronorarus salvus TaxID=3117733 RepID=UPI002F26B183